MPRNAEGRAMPDIDVDFKDNPDRKSSENYKVEIQDLNKILLEVQALIDNKHQETLNIKRKNLELYKANDFLSNALKEMNDSSSWRLTAPLRKIADQLRKRSRKLENNRSKNEYLTYFDPKKKIRYKRIRFEIHSEPEISIIIPVYNQWAYTYNCLRSLSKSLAGIHYEIIIGDDASDDMTKEINKYIENVQVVRSESNRGFISNCNGSAERAKGEYLLFLNNDTEVFKTTIHSLLDTIKKDRRTGVVGGKILQSNGTLLEAGNIMYRDGSSQSYGRNDDPLRPEYNYLREIHFCSGSLMMTRKNLFKQLGGFDIRYSPAYYEDADYCMKLRERKYRIVYQPEAQIVHFESKSYKGISINQYLERNKKIFQKVWRRDLSQLIRRDSHQILLAVASANSNPRILFIDDMIPDPTLGGGYPRSWSLLKVLVGLPFFVTVFPMINQTKIEKYASHLQQLGMETVYNVGDHAQDFESFFIQRADYYDIIFISRPHNFRDAYDSIRRYNKTVRIIYDAEALYSLREIKRLEVNNIHITKDQKSKLLKEEIDTASQADAIVAVSEKEAKIFKKSGIKNVSVLSHEIFPSVSSVSFSNKSDLLFVGGIQSPEIKTPNYDAVLHFTTHVLPLINKKIECNFYIVGRYDLPQARKLRNRHVKLVGPVDDLSEYFNRCKLFVVPTRFAAGVPLKLIEASAFGIPSVVTPLIADQMCWNDNDQCLVGKNDIDFANKVIKLYTHEKIWSRIQSNSLHNINKRFSHDKFSKAVRRIFEPSEKSDKQNDNIVDKDADGTENIDYKYLSNELSQIVKGVIDQRDNVANPDKRSPLKKKRQKK